jgi:hypothetical protein
MRVLPKSWIGVGVLSVVLGLALVFGTESWRWLGAIGVVLGLVLVMNGPPGESSEPGGAPRASRPDHSCCVPRQLADETSARRTRRRQGSY